MVSLLQTEFTFNLKLDKVVAFSPLFSKVSTHENEHKTFIGLTGTLVPFAIMCATATTDY